MYSRTLLPALLLTTFELGSGADQRPHTHPSNAGQGAFNSKDSDAPHPEHTVDAFTELLRKLTLSFGPSTEQAERLHFRLCKAQGPPSDEQTRAAALAVGLKVPAQTPGMEAAATQDSNSSAQAPGPAKSMTRADQLKGYWKETFGAINDIEPCLWGPKIRIYFKTEHPTPLSGATDFPNSTPAYWLYKMIMACTRDDTPMRLVLQWSESGPRSRRIGPLEMVGGLKTEAGHLDVRVEVIDMHALEEAQLGEVESFLSGLRSHLQMSGMSFSGAPPSWWETAKPEGECLAASVFREFWASRVISDKTNAWDSMPEMRIEPAVDYLLDLSRSAISKDEAYLFYSRLRGTAPDLSLEDLHSAAIFLGVDKYSRIDVHRTDANGKAEAEEPALGSARAQHLRKMWKETFQSIPGIHCRLTPWPNVAVRITGDPKIKKQLLQTFPPAFRLYQVCKLILENNGLSSTPISLFSLHVLVGREPRASDRLDILSGEGMELFISVSFIDLATATDSTLDQLEAFLNDTRDHIDMLAELGSSRAFPPGPRGSLNYRLRLAMSLCSEGTKPPAFRPQPRSAAAIYYASRPTSEPATVGPDSRHLPKAQPTPLATAHGPAVSSAGASKPSKAERIAAIRKNWKDAFSALEYTRGAFQPLDSLESTAHVRVVGFSPELPSVDLCILTERTKGKYLYKKMIELSKVDDAPFLLVMEPSKEPVNASTSAAHELCGKLIIVTVTHVDLELADEGQLERLESLVSKAARPRKNH